MGKLGLEPTGGRWGTITRLRDQMHRLFACSIRYFYRAPGRPERDALATSRLTLWWDPVAPDQPDLFGSFIELSPEFFRAIVENPVPVDLRVLRVLRSPLALDLYCWLTYRASYLHRPTEIPWSVLARQFGAGYKEPRQFRYELLHQAKAVIRLYPALRISEGERGLVLSPSEPHVPRQPIRR
jgi:hypothetical protein